MTRSQIRLLEQIVKTLATTESILERFIGNLKSNDVEKFKVQQKYLYGVMIELGELTPVGKKARKRSETGGQA